MATLETLRKRSGLLIAIVVGLALVAFILGDLTSSNGSIFSGNQREIMKIGKKSVEIDFFENETNRLIEYNKQKYGIRNLDDNMTNTYRDQSWNKMVNDLMLQEEFEKLGLFVSSEELYDAIQGTNPHQLVMELFNNPQTGIFERANLLNFLKNIDEYASEEHKFLWYYTEDLIENERYNVKYYNLINKGINTTTYEAQLRHKENATMANCEFVVLKYDEIKDEDVTITDSDLSKYYQEHKKEFKEKPSRDIEYVTFPIVPSNDDFSEARKWIFDIYKDFAATQEEEQFVNLNSDSSYSAMNLAYGDIDAYYRDSVYNQDTGFVFGPYFQNNKFKIVKVVEKFMLPDSVRARHIIIQFDQNRTKEQVQMLADSLKKEIEKGADFAAIAQAYSADQTADKGGDLGWFREGKMVNQFNDSCFHAKLGKLMLVETQFGYHIVQVTEKSANVKKLKLAVLQRDVVPSSKTYNDIYTRATKFAGMNTTKEKFEAAATEQQLPILRANNILENDHGFGSFSTAREVVRWVFKSEKGEVSGPMEHDNNFVVATVVEVREEGIAPLESVKDRIRLQVIIEKKAEMLKQKINEQNAANLDELASKLGVEKMTASNVTFASFSVQNMGVDPVVPAAIIALEPGVVSQPIQGQNGVYVAQLTSKQEAQEMENYDIYKTSIANEKQQRVYRGYVDALKDVYELVDKRSNFY